MITGLCVKIELAWINSNVKVRKVLTLGLRKTLQLLFLLFYILFYKLHVNAQWKKRFSWVILSNDSIYCYVFAEACFQGLLKSSLLKVGSYLARCLQKRREKMAVNLTVIQFLLIEVMLFYQSWSVFFSFLRGNL